VTLHITPIERRKQTNNNRIKMREALHVLKCNWNLLSKEKSMRHARKVSKHNVPEQIEGLMDDEGSNKNFW
jgi:hypothetical protein